MAEHGRRTVRDLRRGNRTAVLRQLYFEGPLSRQALGPATGLSSGSISNVVAELTGEGLLEEAGVIESEGGRPRTLLRVAAGSARLIGVDKNRIGHIMSRYSDASNASVYINTKRVEYGAKLLLEHPEYTIAAIANECGMTNTVTFNRTFKEVYGMTPSEYRTKPQKTKKTKIWGIEP